MTVYQDGDGKIRLWFAQDRDEESDLCELTEDYEEVRRIAEDHGGTVVEMTYEYYDSETVEDYRPQCDECHDILTEEDELRKDRDDLCENCYRQWVEDQTPQEDDLITEDFNKFYQNGKLVVEVEPEEPWEPAVKAWMDKEQYFPTVWRISDHGNAEPATWVRHD